MAGSKKWYTYETNGGDLFAISLDESNTEAVNTTPEAWAVGDSRLGIPKNLLIRKFVYISPDGARKLSVVPLTPAEYLTPPNTIIDPLGDGTATLNFLDAIPERIKPNPRAGDSGINDGDTP